MADTVAAGRGVVMLTAGVSAVSTSPGENSWGWINVELDQDMTASHVRGSGWSQELHTHDF